MFFSVLDSRGLYTYANPLGTQSPAGAMSVANNVNCDQIGITTTRRGFDYYSYQKLTNISKLFSYDGGLYASYDSGKLAKDNGAGVWTPYAGLTMLPPSGGFLHQMLAGGNSYFTTANGIYKLSGSSAPAPAGAPQGLDTQVAVSAQISSGFLNAQSQCAYKVVWGYTDESNLQILGAPSYPVYAVNTQAAGASNNANTTVTFTIPPFVLASSSLPWFYQIYRTPNTSSLSVPPGNNYQLVSQGTPASGDLTNRYVSFSDTVLDSFLGAFLYTNDGQPGVGAPYGLPPLARSVSYFSSMAFYGNYQTMQNVILTLVSVGATSGIQTGDTLTITDSGGHAYTYIAGSINNPTTRHFSIVTSGTASANIQATAQNLALVINRDPNNALFAMQYTSGYSDLPGQLQIFAQNLSQAYFSLTSSRSTCWSPTIPASGTAYASSSVSLQHGLQVSAIGMPESVPPANLLPVGSPNFPILGLLPVRTALLAFKGEEGVYQISGTSPSTLSVTLLDSTAFINGSETLVPLNNSGYFFTTQGVMLANESGCEIMSRDIQGDLLALASSDYPNFASLAFSVGYQSDNAYILFLQKYASDTYSTLQYRYNWITQAWSTWDVPCTAAVANPADDQLYLATPSGYVLKERKSFTSEDFADQAEPITISSVGTGTLTLADSSGVNIGDQITQTTGPNTYTAWVDDNDASTGKIEVSSTTGFFPGVAHDIQAINWQITFMPTSCGYPGFIKKFQTWNFEFSNISFKSCTASFTTDFSTASESVELVPKQANTWGTFAWGTVPWGVTTPALQPISTYATKNTSLGHWVNVSLQGQYAFSGGALSGYAIFYEFMGQRSR